jgi:hypothetical protein
MSRRGDERIAEFLIDGNDAVDLVVAALARLDAAPADGEALGRGIDACRRLARGAAPLGRRRVVALATTVARRLADALNGRRALSEEDMDGLIASADEIRAILDRLEAGGGEKPEERS